VGREEGRRDRRPQGDNGDWLNTIDKRRSLKIAGDEATQQRGEGE